MPSQRPCEYRSNLFGFFHWCLIALSPMWALALPAIFIWTLYPGNMESGYLTMAVVLLSGTIPLVALSLTKLFGANKICITDQTISAPFYALGSADETLPAEQASPKTNACAWTCLIPTGRETIAYPFKFYWSDLRNVHLRAAGPGSIDSDSIVLEFENRVAFIFRLSLLNLEALTQLHSALIKHRDQVLQNSTLQNSPERYQQAVNRLAPDCKTSLPCAKEDAVEIRYSPYQSLTRFAKFLMTYEKQYWNVWLLSLALPFLLQSPHFLDALLTAFTGHKAAGVQPVLDAYDATLRPYTMVLGNGVENSGMFLWQLITNPVVGLLFLVFVCSCTLALARLVSQPTGILLDADGVSLQRSNFLLANGFVEAFSWKQLQAVKLIKPHGTTMQEHWSVGFVTDNGKTTEIRLAWIPTTDDRQRLIAAVSRWAPHASHDADFAQAMVPPQPKSYTELWLTSLAAPPKRERLAPLTPKTKLQNGRYEIESQLGTGGQGVAYVGTDCRAVRRIGKSPSTLVLKEFILPVYVEKKVRRQALERFEREATLLHALDHPQIVKLTDFFIEDHRGYLVLEHIDGLSLRSLVEDNGPVCNERAHELALQMCTILEFLHGLSPPVVHRDFTPENLILGKDGVLKLIDFNVAQQSESTKTGTVVGKHAYLPPEQFRGKPIPQSDIYSLGSTLHFLLTGQDPEPLTTMYPRLLRDEVSEQLSAIVTNCMQLESKMRPQSAYALRESLLDSEYAGGEIISTALKTEAYDRP